MGGFDRLEVRVEQVQRPIGDVQLVDRIYHGSVRTRPLGFANARGLLEGAGGSAQRRVEVAGHLVANGQEEPDAQKGQDQEKHPRVPRRELEAQPGERGHAGALTCRTGIPRRAAS